MKRVSREARDTAGEGARAPQTPSSEKGWRSEAQVDRPAPQVIIDKWPIEIRTSSRNGCEATAGLSIVNLRSPAIGKMALE